MPDLLTSVVDSSPAAMFTWRGYDRATRRFGDFVSLNQALLDLLGCSSAEAIRGTTVLSDAFGSAWSDAHDTLIEEGFWASRIQVRRLDGMLRWLDARVWWFPSEDLGAAIFEDVDDLVRLEDEVAVSADAYQHLFEHSSAGMYRIDHGGNVLEVNQSAAALLGYPSAAAMREARPSVNALLEDPDDREEIGRLLREGGSVSRVVRMTSASGSPAWIRLEMTCDPTREVIEGIAVDVTPERETRRELVESIQKYRVGFDNAVAGMLVCRLKTRELLAANDHFARCLGFSSALELREVARPPFHPLSNLLWKVAELRDGGEQTGVIEADLHGVDGREVHVTASVQVQDDQDQVFIVAINTTDEHRSARRRERLLTELQIQSERHQATAAHLMEAAERERRLVARRIEEGPARQIASILPRLTQPVPAGVAFSSELQSLDAAIELLRGALGNVRQLLGYLRPAALDDLGLPTAMSAAFGQALDAAGKEFRLSVLGAGVEMDRTVEVALFRTAQEIVLDSVRRSAASVIRATIDFTDPREATMTIADPGRAYPLAVAGGPLGWGSLQPAERIALVDGELAVTSDPVSGSTFRITVPRTLPEEVFDERPA